MEPLSTVWAAIQTSFIGIGLGIIIYLILNIELNLKITSNCNNIYDCQKLVLTKNYTFSNRGIKGFVKNIMLLIFTF